MCVCAAASLRRRWFIGEERTNTALKWLSDRLKGDNQSKICFVIFGRLDYNDINFLFFYKI